MDKDYYQTLCIPRLSSQEQIANSYRKLALRWHPKLAKQDATTSQHYFAEVSEAYEVLSDPIKKAFYDKYGWKKLKEGLFEEGGLKGGYRFGNNAQQIFQKFFDSNNAFEQVFDKKIVGKGSMFSHAFGGLNYTDQNVNPDVIIKVPCQLSQFYTGFAKKIQYSRQALNSDGRTLSTQTVQKLIDVKPGLSSEAVLSYQGQGNDSISRNKSNLICKLVEIPHQSYKREGNNLIYTAKISLASALSCEPLQVMTLDNRKLRISLDQIPSPTLIREVPKQGMPLVKSPKQKGNLYIKFDIQFPKALNLQVKDQLRKLLS